MAGLVDPSGNQAASYFYCPTGNPADGPFGTAAAGNPFQYDSAYYDSSFQSYWMDGQQFDSNSGNAFALNLSPDQIQEELLAMGDLGLILPINPTLPNTSQPFPGQGAVYDQAVPADVTVPPAASEACVAAAITLTGALIGSVASRSAVLEGAAGAASTGFGAAVAAAGALYAAETSCEEPAPSPLYV